MTATAAPDHRASSRRQLREALAAVEANSAAWRPWAELALYDAASLGTRITSDDVWLILQRQGIPAPSEPRAMGPVMLAGIRYGWVRSTPEFEVAANPATSRNHGRPQRVYASLLPNSSGAVWPERKAPQGLLEVLPAPPIEGRWLCTSCRGEAEVRNVSIDPAWGDGWCPACRGARVLRRSAV